MNLEDHIDSEKISTVLFLKESCEHCGEVFRLLKSVVKTFRIPLYIVWLENNGNLFDKYSVQLVPTCIVFREGRVYDILEGLGSEDEYRSLML